MQQIKNKDLPEDLQEWLYHATTGKVRSEFKVYSFNSRFIIIKKLYSSIQFERKQCHWLVFGWAEQNHINSFMFKKVGNLTKSDKVKILKDFSLDVTKERKKVN